MSRMRTATLTMVLRGCLCRLRRGVTKRRFRSYSVEALFRRSDLGEYASVKSLLGCRDFLYLRVRIYAEEQQALALSAPALSPLFSRCRS